MKFQFHVLFISVLGFLSPVIPFMFLAGFSIFLDTGFGLWAAYKNNIPRTSAKAQRILFKMLVYNAILLLAFLIDKIVVEIITKGHLGFDLPITRITIIAIILNELYSVDEKIVSVYGPDKGLWSLFKRAFSMAKKIKDKKDELI